MNDFRLFSAYLAGKIRKVYFMALPENKKDLKKSRVCYTVGDSATQAIAQLITGTFMAALLTFVGVRDGNIGIITSIVSLTAVFQVLTIGYIEGLKKRKLWVCICVLQKLWFAFLYFIPFFSWSDQRKRIVMVVCLILAQIFVQAGVPATLDWIANLIPPRLRGRYLAIKDAIAVFVTVTVILCMGIVMDITKKDNIYLGFALVGILILILTVINVVAFSLMKEPKLSYLNEQGKEMHGHLAKLAKEKQQTVKMHVFQEMKKSIQCSRFLKALILNCMWMTAFYIAAPFNASYQLKELKLPYTFIMAVNFLASMLRVFVTARGGKLADRVGMARVLKYSLCFMGVSYGLLVFTVPANGYWLFPITAVLAAVGWSFIPVGLLGVQLDFLEEEKRALQLAMISAISGIYGFLVSVVGGKVVDAIQTSQLHIGQTVLYAQQLTNLFGTIAIVVMILYINCCVQKEKSVETGY